MKKHSAKKSTAERRARVPKRGRSDHNPKVVGEVIEQLFTYEFRRRGVTVCKPVGDSARYDRLIDRGPKFPHDGLGRFVTVQVRGVLRPRSGCAAHSVCTRYSRKEQRCLMPEDAAVLAAYAANAKIWYFIPTRTFAPAKYLPIYPEGLGLERSGHPKNLKYEKWREAWHVLAPGRASKDVIADWINLDWPSWAKRRLKSKLTRDRDKPTRRKNAR